MLLLRVKGKEVNFAVSSMTADSQLRRRDIEGFHDILTLTLKRVTA